MAALVNHPQLARTEGNPPDTAVSLVSENALENQVLSQVFADFGLVSTSITGATFPVAPVPRQFFVLVGHATLTNGLFQEDGGGGWQRLSQIA